MTTTIPAGSAQIYQFPPRGRFALNARDENRTAIASTPVIRVVSSGWYHDAAIQEAEHSRSN
jgi:Protein of unknown function (DUF2735)